MPSLPTYFLLPAKAIGLCGFLYLFGGWLIVPPSVILGF